jgi:hypothetical protein
MEVWVVCRIGCDVPLAAFSSRARAEDFMLRHPDWQCRCMVLLINPAYGVAQGVAQAA